MNQWCAATLLSDLLLQIINLVTNRNRVTWDMIVTWLGGECKALARYFSHAAEKLSFFLSSETFIHQFDLFLSRLWIRRSLLHRFVNCRRFRSSAALCLGKNQVFTFRNYNQARLPSHCSLKGAITFQRNEITHPPVELFFIIFMHTFH